MEELYLKQENRYIGELVINIKLVILFVILDLNKKQLSYGRNDKLLDVAFDNIKIGTNIQYRLTSLVSAADCNLEFCKMLMISIEKKT